MTANCDDGPAAGEGAGRIELFLDIPIELQEAVRSSTSQEYRLQLIRAFLEGRDWEQLLGDGDTARGLSTSK